MSNFELELKFVPTLSAIMMNLTVVSRYVSYYPKVVYPIPIPIIDMTGFVIYDLNTFLNVNLS